ncbi:hypothetical protein EHI8A_048070 [Entamoeba histolytica HM-1:IMSS-B]|uniref:Uncharacterized protein n=6 Tax=Entamoeba histolytica TaxID=5759 RepID=C4MA55_ENTH1|nr:hypothetical protein EHI_061750 [Entamoeba histolytica HM-1:IMSS]EMD44777.1 Hypothetical protein EHI5A_084000 [Entamoeba histolytica KU27]EMH76374.1 hypothetical protein EHI8A_048070 [Entamoeba histolytica HM-1:IMSS-B]EMS14797.1 hypothetical protein KM1_094310 [Entamoeba histolytica HM-3:IMSS]ENY64685.1 hypothetical protein EHI7A_046960 [Entamoeba histolytica HM-1:IMSS-A]GAT98639.1 hypothetical protein CL6EHI_061750 [Entamoeba histolytica]|eukprot:XP_648523.1 hypothetical protein EHI_061750 [Entamoeba histolytica HM-1:IMSS]
MQQENGNCIIVTPEYNMESILERLNKIEKTLSTLPKIIEDIISSCLNKYLIMPEDYASSMKRLSQMINEKEVSQKSSNEKKGIKEEEYYLKQNKEESKRNCPSLSSTLEVGIETNKGLEELSTDIIDSTKQGNITLNSELVTKPITIFETLPEKSQTFFVQENFVIVYNENKGVVRLNDEEVVFNICNYNVNDLNGTDAGSILVATDEKLFLINKGEVDEVIGSFTSACEFNKQIVTASKRGLNYKVNGKDVIIKNLTSKIQLEIPTKIRASKSYLFVQDIGTNIITVFNTSFKAIKAINSKNVVDFCVINDNQFAILTSKSIKIIRFAEHTLTAEYKIPLKINQQPILLKRIEFVRNLHEQYIVGLSQDMITTYKIPIDLL